ncbi:uncharacterized protein LOC122879529 isoform X4 [Scomber scombrus]|uniref:Uncharacterized protein LOC122879529 isoform X4 n=1 Tax=Scomber scombrus TaxID=13677 RepID=A0AAV1PKH2_SCOSC
MATNNCQQLEYIGIFDNAFFFKGKNDNVGCDALQLDQYNLLEYFIRSQDSKYLIFNHDGFHAQTLSVQGKNKPECKFCIQVYNNDESTGKGLEVMLYVNKEGKKMVVSCKDMDNIYAEEKELPGTIGEDDHGAVFTMKSTATSNEYLLESYKYKSRYLAFETHRDTGNIKLILRHKHEDVVDEPCQLRFSPR